MALNHEFGDYPKVPSGISGDIEVVHQTNSETSRQAMIAQRAIFDELLDRQTCGMTTSDEDLLIAQRLASEVAQGYN